MIDLSSRRSFYLYCRFCARLRDILYDAPWSSFDLIASCTIFWLGIYLIFSPNLFDEYPKTYWVLARFGQEIRWGSMFAAIGTFGLTVTLWVTKPSFLLRLLSRMGVAFCFISLALNNFENDPPLVSAITYSVLALAAIWGILRTRGNGG